jgi:biopolymer transport protein TolR
VTYRKDRRVFIDDEGIPIDVLAERMRQALRTRNDKQLYLRGDGAVQLQELMDVFGRLKEAGVEKIGIVAQERRAQ